MKLQNILQESNSYSQLVDHILAYVHEMSQTTGDAPEQVLSDFQQHVLPDLMKDLEHRLYMSKR